MGKLAEALLAGEKRPAVVGDICALIDAEVARTSGLIGFALKGGYAVVKGLRPGFIVNSVDHMLDEFVGTLEPLYDEHLRAGDGQPMEAFLAARRDAMAEALLAITDTRANKAPAGVLRKTYGKLRPFGKKHVAEAAPGVGRLIDRHARTA